jgi:NADP-dependent 3-hydroxy acid dehydrogenase YdfG
VRSGTKALAVPVDVSRYWEVEAAVTAAVDTFGTVDILINNAGAIEPVARMESADPEAWGQVIDVNLKGVFHGMHAVLPIMLAQGRRQHHHHQFRGRPQPAGGVEPLLRIEGRRGDADALPAP